MRLILFICSFHILLLAQPAWFLNIPIKKSSVYIGYGEALSFEEAKHEALVDISSQILIHVDSKMDAVTEINNGKVSKSFNEQSSQKTVAQLSDYQLVHREYENGKYYIAIAYENIPLLDKFIKKIKKKYPTINDKITSKYLAGTPVAYELAKKLHKQIDFNLIRKDKKYFIYYKNIMQALDKRTFSKFFATIANKKISIAINKKRNILYNGDYFYFLVKTNESGYVTIFDVYEDGTVAILLSNIAIKKDKLYALPGSNYGSIPQAGLLEDGEETYDLFIALWSKEKIDYNQFAWGDEEKTEEEKYKNFDTLLNFMNNKNFSGVKVVTKPR